MSRGADPEASSTLVEHFFRHESGRLTAVLVKRFGAQRLELIEDAIQHALERALGTWTRQGTPDEPSAWLTRVATNFVLDALRRDRAAAARDTRLADAAPEPAGAPSDLGPAGQGVDDYLALLFACADERLAPRTRLVLCLKLLSGFSTEEIAGRLFMTSVNVQKTLERGRRQLGEVYGKHAPPLTAEDRAARLATVQLVLYLQFNEGYSLGPGDQGLRVELCEEAIRLTRMLATNPVGDAGSSWGLLALMHLNAARLTARISADGKLIPLRNQDRSQWDRTHVRLGLEAVRVAAERGDFSRYVGEAAIQVEHVLAPTFGHTRWQEIVELYRALERIQPSPVYALNRVIAQAELGGPELALSALATDSFPPWFRDHYLYRGTRGELLLRRHEYAEAAHELASAAQAAPSQVERQYFEERAREALSHP